MKRPVAPIRAFGLLLGVIVNGGLLTWIALELTSDGSAAVERADWKADLTGSISESPVRRSLENYASIMAHPLFFKSRAPYVPPPPAPPPVAAAPPVATDPGVIVAGVMLTNGLSKAYLSNKAGQDGAWTSQDEVFRGWRVKSIDEAGVVLEQGGRSVDLQLYPRN
jgi:hypothetical protein